MSSIFRLVQTGGVFTCISRMQNSKTVHESYPDGCISSDSTCLHFVAYVRVTSQHYSEIWAASVCWYILTPFREFQHFQRAHGSVSVKCWCIRIYCRAHLNLVCFWAVQLIKIKAVTFCWPRQHFALSVWPHARREDRHVGNADSSSAEMSFSRKVSFV